ncbi:putative MFS family arabinose efflux permease [Tamaricihabitans halophyticus]|uniref:Putative MFS family arabinose efflux permease n=1 Tax=Tamaricihabitans halophyticus TaxID=1262583 RepID=A0A4R2R2A9_9PSEU|nr:MFS transporter [Tamaricihabitans halophyticus]TCP56157.1 putative MFS family arabinose efflux permease [Tamaricihabitans halophyticus]
MTEVRAQRLGANYWRLWTSSGLANLADGIFKIALPLVAIQFTRSPVLIAGVTLAVTLPWLLFALPAGALVDRLDRRKAMLVAEVIRATMLGLLMLAMVFGVGSIWALFVVAVCVGSCETIYDTAAQSIVPQIVQRDQLTRANGRLYGAELTANEFIGPPLAGALVAGGAVLAFGAPAGLWFLALLPLVLVRGDYRVARTAPTTLRADIRAGLRFLMGNRVLRTLAVMVGVMNFARQAMMAVFVLYAVGASSAMGLSESAFGALLTATAAGGLAGSGCAEWLERRLGRARTLLFSVLLGVPMAALPAMTVNPYLIGAGFFLGGVCVIVWNVVVVSLRQRITPDGMLGRLNSCFRLLAWGTMPLGAATGGVVAELLGLRGVFLFSAALSLIVVVGLLVVTDRAMDAAEQAVHSDVDHSRT